MTARRVAYLTIDDAPSPLMPEKLAYLSARGIPAVLFCQGDHLEKRPGFAREALREGFLLGNHSYDHPRFSTIELEECFEQIRRTDAIIQSLYRSAGAEWSARCFRFPYGDKGDASPAGGKKNAIQDFLRKSGYAPAPSAGITYRYYHDRGLDKDIDWYWTYDSMDWSLNLPEPSFGIDSVEKVLARMDDDDPEGGRGLSSGTSLEIVLVHDHEQTSKFFPRIIERLLEKGLSFELPFSTRPVPGEPDA